MIRYCITRVWLFHGRLMDSAPSFSALKEKNGQPIGRWNFTVEGHALNGMIQAKWRELCDFEMHGHNLFPAIDLDADDQMCGELGDYLLGHQADTLRLEKFRVRITDYGHLNVLLIFRLKDVGGLASVDATEITRKVNALVPDFDRIMLKLRDENKCILFREEYFGVPGKLKGFVKVDHTDTYTYEEIVFITSEEERVIAQVKEYFSYDDEPEHFDMFRVYGLAQLPVWSSNRDFTAGEVAACLEPHNLLLCERNLYDVSSTLYFSIIDLMSLTDLAKPKFSLFKKHNKKVRAYEDFTSSDLRKLTLNFGNILHQVVSRRTALKTWQDDYITQFKQKYPLTEYKDMAEHGQQLLSVMVNEKTNSENEKHNRLTEVIFLFLTSLTLYSVYVDLITFLEAEHNDFKSVTLSVLETKLILILTIVLGILIVAVLRKKKRLR